MGALAKYLLEHMVLDFDGEIDMEHINAFLLEDGSPAAHELRSRLISEGGPNEFLLVLADVLKDFTREGIREEHVVEQVVYYLEA